MVRATKGTIEAEIANAMTRFQREQQGRGPQDVRAYLLADLVLVRSTGIFTATETRLAVTDDGRKIIRSARQELRAINHEAAEAIVANIVECDVVRSYCDMDVEIGEQMEVYVLAADVERRMELDRLSGISVQPSR